MGISVFPPILLGLSVDLIVFVTCYLTTNFIKTTPDFNTRAYGLGGTVTATAAFLYFLVSRWTPVRSWTFYLAFLPLFFISAFDFAASIDFCLKPNDFLLSEYININDKLMGSIWAELGTMADGFLLHFLNFVVLWRAWNGLSWRSLLIFNGSCLASMYLVFLGVVGVHATPYQIHPIVLGFIPTAPIYFAIPIAALFSKRNFTFVKAQTSILVRLFDLFTAVLLLASVATIVAKFLTVQGSSLLPKELELIRGNDPILLFNEDLKSVLPVSIGVIQLLGYLVFTVPTLAFNLYYKFQSRKPAFLWELTVVQFAVIVCFQFYYIGGALYWATPSAFKVSVENPAFWLINGLPLLATALDLISLIPYRVKAETVSAKSKSSKKQK